MQHFSDGCTPAAETPAGETPAGEPPAGETKAPAENAAANSDAATAATTTADDEPYAGLHRATDADGTILIEDLRPDGI